MSEETVEYIDLTPDIDGMKHYLRQVAREDDATALWGVGMARALGILDWYGETLSEARGWKA